MRRHTQSHPHRVGRAMGYQSCRTIWYNRVKLVHAAIDAARVLLPELTVLIVQYSEPVQPMPMPFLDFMRDRFAWKLASCRNAPKTMQIIKTILPTTLFHIRGRIVSTICLIVDLRLAEPAQMFRYMLFDVWQRMCDNDRTMVRACWTLEVIRVATKEVIHTRLSHGTWLSSQMRDPPHFYNPRCAVFKSWVRSPFAQYEEGQFDAGWPLSISAETGFTFSTEPIPPDVLFEEGRQWTPRTLRRSARLNKD